MMPEAISIAAAPAELLATGGASTRDRTGEREGRKRQEEQEREEREKESEEGSATTEFRTGAGETDAPPSELPGSPEDAAAIICHHWSNTVSRNFRLLSPRRRLHQAQLERGKPPYSGEISITSNIMPKGAPGE